MTYAPVTLIIKGLMAVVAYYGFKLFNLKFGDTISRIVSSVFTEVVMILGYFIFEGFLYGFIPSLVNIPANTVQGTAGIILGVMLINIFKNTI